MSDENHYELDLEERVSDVENAATNAETVAMEAKRTADKWETECEFMLKRITTLENQVIALNKAIEQLIKPLPKK